jgi:hypothetical protein
MADQSLPIEGTLDLTPVHTPRLTWLEVVHEWVTTVDHKKLGLMYMMMAIFFLLVAGAEVLCIRSLGRTITSCRPRSSTGSSPCMAPPWSSSWAFR